MFSTYLDLNRYFYLYCSHIICFFPEIIQSKTENGSKQNEYVKIKMYNSMWVIWVLWMELSSLFVLILEKKIIAQRERFMDIG